MQLRVYVEKKLTCVVGQSIVVFILLWHMSPKDVAAENVKISCAVVRGGGPGKVRYVGHDL